MFMQNFCAKIWKEPCWKTKPEMGDNLVNKTNFVHNLFVVYLYLSISTCFGQLWAHHQEIKLCLCDTWYLLFCVDDCLVCRLDPRSALHTRQSSTQNNNYQVSHKHSFFSWWWAHSHLKHVEIDKYKYTKNKLCTKLVLFTRLYRDVRSTKYKIQNWETILQWVSRKLILLTWIGLHIL